MSETSFVEPKEKFTVVGIITSDEFQKCRFIVDKLCHSFPKRYESPQIRPMLDIEWNEYLTKAQRKFGDGFWVVNKSVVVFVDNEYLGNDAALEKYVAKKYRFTLIKDWLELGKCHLVDYLGNIMRKFRQLAYLTISIDDKVIGTLLFELYNDIVPLACENFLNRCKDKRKNSYHGVPIHRILKNSWIQCGGWQLEEKRMRCENYAVPHDRRGVLTTCNDGRHTNNTTQFFVTLAPAPWMDYKYVAFGQLIQGAEVLRKIEEVPTYYQSPRYPIHIVRSGELAFNTPPDYISNEDLNKFQLMRQSAILEALIGPPIAPAPSVDSYYYLKKAKRSVSASRRAWGSGYMLPEEMGEKADYDYFKKMTARFFDPFYYLNLSKKQPSSPPSSDVTI